MLHQERLVEHGQARQLDRAITERAGLGKLSPVERRVGSGVAYDDLQTLLLVAYEFCARPVLAAQLSATQPQARCQIGHMSPLIANLGGVHRVLRFFCLLSLPAAGSAGPTTASRSSQHIR